jgi:hypothetical protein
VSEQALYPRRLASICPEFNGALGMTQHSLLRLIAIASLFVINTAVGQPLTFGFNDQWYPLSYRSETGAVAGVYQTLPAPYLRRPGLLNRHWLAYRGIGFNWMSNGAD